MWLWDTGKAFFFFCLLIGLRFSCSKFFFLLKKLHSAFMDQGFWIFIVFGSFTYLYITLPIPTSPFPTCPKNKVWGGRLGHSFKYRWVLELIATLKKEKEIFILIMLVSYIHWYIMAGTLCKYSLYSISTWIFSAYQLLICAVQIYSSWSEYPSWHIDCWSICWCCTIFFNVCCWAIALIKSRCCGRFGAGSKHVVSRFFASWTHQ